MLRIAGRTMLRIAGRTMLRIAGRTLHRVRDTKSPLPWTYPALRGTN
jgi:hypothetical protein